MFIHEGSLHTLTRLPLWRIVVVYFWIYVIRRSFIHSLFESGRQDVKYPCVSRWQAPNVSRKLAHASRISFRIFVFFSLRHKFIHCSFFFFCVCVILWLKQSASSFLMWSPFVIWSPFFLHSSFPFAFLTGKEKAKKCEESYYRIKPGLHRVVELVSGSLHSLRCWYALCS